MVFEVCGFVFRDVFEFLMFTCRLSQLLFCHGTTNRSGMWETTLVQNKGFSPRSRHLDRFIDRFFWRRFHRARSHLNNLPQADKGIHQVFSEQAIGKNNTHEESMGLTAPSPTKIYTRNICATDVDGRLCAVP